MLELRDALVKQGAFCLRASFQLKPGDKLALIGPSGAGKSTLLAGIAGFAETEGSLSWNGATLSDRPDERPVSMLFQHDNLFAHLTALQNVGLGLRPSLKLSPDEHLQARAALQQVGLAGLEDRKPAQLSGGQQSRVAIARLLVMARPVLLLDEPFSALGPGQRVEMMQLVCGVADKLSAVMIVVTHDPAEARALGGLVSFVAGGQITPPREAGAFFEDPPDGLNQYVGS